MGAGPATYDTSWPAAVDPGQSCWSLGPDALRVRTDRNQHRRAHWLLSAVAATQLKSQIIHTLAPGAVHLAGTRLHRSHVLANEDETSAVVMTAGEDPPPSAYSASHSPPTALPGNQDPVWGTPSSWGHHFCRNTAALQYLTGKADRTGYPESLGSVTPEPGLMVPPLVLNLVKSRSLI